MKNEKFVMTKDAALKFFTAMDNDADTIKMFLDDLVEDMLNDRGCLLVVDQLCCPDDEFFGVILKLAEGGRLNAG